MADIGLVWDPNTHPQTVSIDDVEVTEGGIATFTVTLNVLYTDESAYPVTVHYITQDGTAIGDTDYQHTNGTIIFPTGSSDGDSKTIEVQTIGDGISEPTETFYVSLSTTNPNVFVLKSSGVGTIIDNDLPTLSIDDVTVSEGDVTADFTVSVVDANGQPTTSDQEIRVDYATADGTAAEGSDYASTSGTLIIPAGQTSRTIQAPILDDAYLEDSENFTVTLSNPVNATIGDDAGVGTIIPDATADTTILTLNNVNVTEGDTNATITASLDNSPEAELVIGLDNGATITFGVGETTATSTPFTVSNDVYVGPDNYQVSVVGFDGGGFEHLDTSDTALVTVSDTIDTTTLNLLGPGQVGEGAGTSYTLYVDNPPKTTDLQVQIQVDHISTEDADFGATTQVGTPFTVTLPVGSFETIFDVSTANDGIYEGLEEYSVTIVGTSGGDYEKLDIGTDSVTTGIVDAEPMPIIHVDPTDAVIEGNVITFNVTLTHQSALPVTVEYNTAGNTATSGVDYEPKSGTLTFAPGETEQQVSVQTIDDAILESEEVFTLDLSNATNGIIQGQGVGTIIPDATADTTILTLNNVNVTEGDTNATITASLDNSPEAELVIGLDNGATITFGVGETTATSTPFTVSNDVYVGPDNYQVSVVGFDGGGFEHLDTSDTALVIVSDAIDTTTLSLSGPQTINEGGNATYALTVTNAPQTDLEVEIEVINATTEDADFDPTPSTQTVIIPAGSSSVTFDVNTFDDITYEDTENFNVKIVSATGGNYENLDIDTTPITTDINDDADIPQISIMDAAPVVEGGNATFTVMLSNPSNFPVTVNYTTSDIDTIADADYTATSGTLTFGPGDTSQTITIPTTDDQVSENTETFNVTLSDPNGGIIVDGTGIGTILDNESVIDIGAKGDDTIIGKEGADILTGNGGDDTIIGKGGDDFISGGADDDILDGGSGDDSIFGNRGDDIIDGGDGNDIIFGGQGNDTITDIDTDFNTIGGTSVIDGERGSDIFKFTTADDAASLELTNSSEVGGRLSGVEILDMQDGGVLGDTLTISKDVIDALGDSNKHTHEIVTNTEYDGRVDIYVRGDTVDTVNLDSDWSQASDAITVGADIYDIWTNVADGEEAVIAIQQDVNVNPA